MPASVGYLVIDTTDPSLLVPFWCGLLDVQVGTTIGDGQFVLLTQTAGGLTVGFQRVPDPKTGKNRLHLDLIVDDLDSVTAEVVGLGGRWLAGRRRVVCWWPGCGGLYSFDGRVTIVGSVSCDG